MTEHDILIKKIIKTEGLIVITQYNIDRLTEEQAGYLSYEEIVKSSKCYISDKGNFFILERAPLLEIDPKGKMFEIIPRTKKQLSQIQKECGVTDLSSAIFTDLKNFRV